MPIGVNKGKCKGRLGGYDWNCNPISLWSLKRKANKILPNIKS